jgi:hypothetical protein
LPLLPFITAVVTGIFLLGGYVIQKALEHRRTVVEKRLETYSMFLKNTFAGMQSRSAKNPRKSKQDFDPSEEIFWKGQISLYGSDEVIRKLGRLSTLLKLNSETDVTSDDLPLAVAFDELMLAMRKDVTPKGCASVHDLRRASPMLIEPSPHS